MGNLSSVIRRLRRRGCRGVSRVSGLGIRVTGGRKSDSVLSRGLRGLRGRLTSISRGLTSGGSGLTITSRRLSRLGGSVRFIGRQARALQRSTVRFSHRTRANTNALVGATVLRDVIASCHSGVASLPPRVGITFSNSPLRAVTRRATRILRYTALLCLNCVSRTAAFTRKRNNKNNNDGSVG